MNLGLAALLVLAGCGGGNGGPAGAPCDGDTDCRTGLACLEAQCAPAFEDPGGEGPPPGGPVRVFAVGIQPRLEDTVSQDSFRDAIRAVVDRDVVPNLATDRPNLLVFPENTGLHAAFIGRRGNAARMATDLAAGFIVLSTAYDAAGLYYLEQFGASGPPGRIVMLSVTDTLRRSLLHTFATMARELEVHVAVTYNVADAECVTNADLVAVFADEDAPDRTCAWRATRGEVPNRTFVYGPDGALVHVFEKEYLVESEEDVLGLAYGPTGNVGALALPFGAISSVISKDAWMPDVLDRMALDDVALVLQPEAWQGYADPHGEHGDWGPDVLKESGWTHVMRYPEFRASVLPCLSGNLLDLAFDCQSAVIADDPGVGGFIGQESDVGFARVASWVIDEGTGSLEERRMRLRDAGNRLLPGSGDPLENMYAPGVVFHDLDLGAPFAPAAAPPGVAVAPGEAGDQRHPDAVALDDGTVLVVWEDTRAGTSRLYGARVRDGVAGEARMRLRSTGHVRWPRLAAHDGLVHLVFQDTGPLGRRLVFHARSADGGRSFGVTGEIDSGSVPDVAVDAASGIAHVVWVRPTSGGPSRVAHVAVTPDGTVGTPAPIDRMPAPGFDPRQNQWGPAVAALGGVVVVAWADFRSYRWEIWGAVSQDHGMTFSDVVRLDDADVAWETVHSDPDVVAAEDGSFWLAWTDLRVRRPDHDVRIRRIDPAAPPGSESSRSLATTDMAGRPQWRPGLAVRAGAPLAVFQDFRDGVNRIRAGGEGDDVAIGSGEAEAFAPRLAVRPDGSAAVVFESVATGRRRIHLVELP